MITKDVPFEQFQVFFNGLNAEIGNFDNKLKSFQSVVLDKMLICDGGSLTDADLDDIERVRLAFFEAAFNLQIFLVKS